ncbi:MAG: hypothetical protein IJX26_01940 [Clostridia bacterium]|nr:hypothetical protein [Clostridia bacterium]
MLSLISGYPIGAKLICDAYNHNQLDLKSAQKMMSFCSVSGPMFIIGSVGIGIFKSLKFGYLLLLSHILGAIINGFVFRNCYELKKYSILPKTSQELMPIPQIETNHETKSTNILADSMLDSITSILLVGGYIVFAFVLIDLLNNIKIIPMLTNFICNIFNIKNTNLVGSMFNGALEMTKGLIGVGANSLSPKLSLVLASFLIGFGGISVFLQSLNFTKNLKLKKSFYIFQKFCQGLFSALISTFFINLL